MADISKIQLPNGAEFNIKDAAVPSWAKESAKPSYTAVEVGALPSDTFIPTKTSELDNDSNFMSGMTILYYGKSTWNEFITAYRANHVVYCRASSNSNPASGSQTRHAFMAYVNNLENPTNVEFQYYRSVSSHSATQQGDQMYVYTLTSSGAWSVTVRESYTRIAAGTGLSQTYSSGVLTVALNSATQSSLSKADTALQSYTETDPTVPAWAKASAKPTYTASEVGALPSNTTYVSSVNGTSGAVTIPALPAVTSSDNGKVLTVVNGAWAAAALPIYQGEVISSASGVNF